MWTEEYVVLEDLEYAVSETFIPWDNLKNKNVLVTGATGLVGSNVVNLLLYAEQKKKLGLSVILLVRNEEKARQMYRLQLEQGLPLTFIEGTIENFVDTKCHIDYVVHAASPTASAYFIENPVETIKTIVNGTECLLSFAANQRCSGFVYISSMEAYGSPMTEDELTEDGVAVVNTMNPRSCYPESKRICEALCSAYASEYKLPANSIRLAQTFGPGVNAADKRVFAEFARCAIADRDIALKTTGESKRMYVYTMDAATAILSVLLSNQMGMVYNVANPDTYCSVADMAEKVIRWFSPGKSKIRFDLNTEDQKKYPPTNCLNLSVTRIMDLGWHPRYGLYDMYHRMITAFDHA